MTLVILFNGELFTSVAVSGWVPAALVFPAFLPPLISRAPLWNDSLLESLASLYHGG